MPSVDKFTNVSTSRGPMPTVPGSRPRRYLANQFGAKVMPLTPNEREARRQAKGHGRNKTAEFSIDPVMGANTVLSGTSNFFSPQMGPDFLEMPQSIREKREMYRHFYNTDEIVAQSLDLHTELPLSKVRLAAPKPRTCPKGYDSPEDYGHYILSYFEKQCKKLKLFQKLIMAVHHLLLDGTCAIFAEDGEVQVPPEVGYKEQLVTRNIITEDGEAREEQEKGYVEKDNREEEELAWYQKHYKGWERLIIFPIDQIHITTYSFTDKTRVELIPSERDRALIEQAKMGDDVAEEMAAEMPAEVREYIGNGKLIPLGTDPDEGSFCYLLSSRKQAGEELGQSLLDRCMRTLYYREKLRQAQYMIASRAMTPKRLVWAEDISDADADNLREQVDLSLVDPDYTIVANYEVHWEEMGSKDRLLDLSTEYEQTERRLRTGLGVTESLLSGETLYSGDRLKLEVINQRYLFMREILQEYVEEYLFKPVARRKGFVEKDKWGEEVVLFPKLSFTRLPLRDSQDTYDALFNLYQKGSVSIDLILEMFNIDPHDTAQKIKGDIFTVNDAIFNELTHGLYSGAAQKIVESTDIAEKLAQYLGLKMSQQQENPADNRFGGG